MIILYQKYKLEVEQRKNLLQKARDSVKLTKEERIWLSTHALYNRQLGFPFFNTAIENLEKNKSHLLKITIDSVSYKDRIVPIIAVPAGQGQIITNGEVIDLKGNKWLNKPVKMLGLESEKSVQFEVQYISQLGLLEVGYECDYFDNKSNLNMRQSSSTGDPDFAMVRHQVSDNKVQYCCKSPLTNSFDALIFSIEWEKTNK